MYNLFLIEKTNTKPETLLAVYYEGKINLLPSRAHKLLAVILLFLPPPTAPHPPGLYNMKGFLKPFERDFLPSSTIKLIVIIKWAWEQVIKKPQFFQFIMKIRKICQIYISLHFKLNEPQFKKKYYFISPAMWQMPLMFYLSIDTSDCPHDGSCILS